MYNQQNLTDSHIKCNVLNGDVKTMIKLEQLQVGLLVWWTASRYMSEWDCPGVITKVDKANNKFRVRTFDNMKECSDLLINRDPGDDKSALEEMIITTEEEVLTFISKKEASFKQRTLEAEQSLDKLKGEADQYSKKANILRVELVAKTPTGIMPKI